ncbi:hypothetical protein J6590_038440 [Homalodisca vitripennis]|nr:hypothetical protein J6590_038440 [Homalodisca vitripennis]
MTFWEKPLRIWSDTFSRQLLRDFGRVQNSASSSGSNRNRVMKSGVPQTPTAADSHLTQGYSRLSAISAPTLTMSSQ